MKRRSIIIGYVLMSLIHAGCETQQHYERNKNLEGKARLKSISLFPLKRIVAKTSGDPEYLSMKISIIHNTGSDVGKELHSKLKLIEDSLIKEIGLIKRYRMGSVEDYETLRMNIIARINSLLIKGEVNGIVIHTIDTGVHR